MESPQTRHPPTAPQWEDVATIITIHQPEPEPEPEIEVVEIISEEPANLSTLDSQPSTLEKLSTVRERDYDRFDIKMNAAYLAAGVTNIGAEMAVSDHWTIDLPLVYSPYTLAQTYRMRFYHITTT